MNDRELLELAARAAGIKARWFRVNQWRRVGGHKMQTGQEMFLELIIASLGTRLPTTATR
ncbi:hypothetical protein [Pseudomonas aeruginosa]|uniref:hypothetical protein n=1 Tax=Pseudomonas aeruginosa TaxID=287 RepID=UPI00367145AB